MRPVLVAWLVARGGPEWIVPDYPLLVCIGSLLGAMYFMHVAKGDGVDLRPQARVLALGYVAALLGGYVFEFLRAVPTAIELRAPRQLLLVGRAAWGGLLGAILAATLYLRRLRLPVGAFFDRCAVGAGIAFFTVRIGCFLEGCDYGHPTASVFGIRFPPGTAPARDHAALGWVPLGASSLPVHPTQLYEALVGALGGLAAWAVLRRQHKRDGTAFLTFLAVYSVGRFLIEFIRGDLSRGIYAGLSTAQWVSLAVFIATCVLLRDLANPGDAGSRSVPP